jgi:hypothetical protein
VRCRVQEIDNGMHSFMLAVDGFGEGRGSMIMVLNIDAEGT